MLRSRSGVITPGSVKRVEFHSEDLCGASFRESWSSAGRRDACLTWIQFFLCVVQPSRLLLQPGGAKLHGIGLPTDSTHEDHEYHRTGHRSAADRDSVLGHLLRRASRCRALPKQGDHRPSGAPIAMKGLFSHCVGRAFVMVRNLGPYAAIELLLPGGSVLALLYWLYRRRTRPAPVHFDDQPLSDVLLFPQKVTDEARSQKCGAAGQLSEGQPCVARRSSCCAAAA